MQINSFHHQAIKELAKGFKVIARSDDGIIEGIENKNIVAVQWHPEYMMDMQFFKYFIDKCIIIITTRKTGGLLLA